MSKALIKISIVSYLNSKPFLYGLQNEPSVEGKISIEEDYPALCGAKLKTGKVDIGLIPVALIPEIKDAHIMGDFCIGALDSVKTVGLYSNNPIEEIQQVYLDYQSKTSVALCQILFQKYWKKNPAYCDAKENFIEKKLEEGEALVVIGDRTIGLESRYTYFYDLAHVWHQCTGKPFVFAAWVSNKPLEDEFITNFNLALSKGMKEIENIAAQWQNNYESHFSVLEYYTKFISFTFDRSKKEGLSLFLQYLSELKNINHAQTNKL